MYDKTLFVVWFLHGRQNLCFQCNFYMSVKTCVWNVIFTYFLCLQCDSYRLTKLVFAVWFVHIFCFCSVISTLVHVFFVCSVISTCMTSHLSAGRWSQMTPTLWGVHPSSLTTRWPWILTSKPSTYLVVVCCPGEDWFCHPKFPYPGVKDANVTQNDTPLTKLTQCQNVVRHCPVYYHNKIQELNFG